MLRRCASLRCLPWSAGNAARRKKCQQSVAPSGFAGSTVGTSTKKPRITRCAAHISFLVSKFRALHNCARFCGRRMRWLACEAGSLRRACNFLSRSDSGVSNKKCTWMCEPMRMCAFVFSLCDPAVLSLAVIFALSTSLFVSKVQSYGSMHVFVTRFHERTFWCFRMNCTARRLENEMAGRRSCFFLLLSPSTFLCLFEFFRETMLPHGRHKPRLGSKP